MGCCCSKPVDGCFPCFSEPVDDPPAEPPSKPVDEPSAGTPSKGDRETQQGIQQEQEQPERKIPSPSKLQRARETAILVLEFTSIIADASEILKPMKVVSDCIKKILEVTKVGFYLPEETSLFTKSQSACRR